LRSGIEENLFYILIFLNVGSTVLGGLWVLEWAWHLSEMNSRIYMLYAKTIALVSVRTDDF